MARERQSDNQAGNRKSGSRRRLWVMLGVGAATIAISAAVIAFAAINYSRSGIELAPDDELPAYAHTIGEPDAPVTIVEYSDMQ